MVRSDYNLGGWSYLLQIWGLATLTLTPQCGCFFVRQGLPPPPHFVTLQEDFPVEQNVWRNVRHYTDNCIVTAAASVTYVKEACSLFGIPRVLLTDLK